MIKRKKEVLLIALSAFFADLGYQAVVAGYPIFLVFGLGLPIYIYGIVEALSYGGGAIFSYIGGRAADKYGHKRMAILGNALIPLLGFTGLAKSAIQAVSLFVGGWWSRNFRSPARRAMVADNTSIEERKEAFGILHALDLGGGMIAVAYSVLLFVFIFGSNAREGLGSIFLIAIIPIFISTLLLFFVKKNGVDAKINTAAKKAPSKKGLIVNTYSSGNKGSFYSILAAATLFGFSSYSFGFPIYTIAEASGVSYLGIISYLVFLGASSFSGYFLGRSRMSDINGLAFAGYLLASLASFGFAYLVGEGIAALYLMAAILGVAVGAIETFEPTIISKIVTKSSEGRGMGDLSMGRSIGLFSGNIIMGFLLFYFGNFYAYTYAALASFIAFLIILRLRKRT
ncbi:MFS transporter [Candidatus Marsarchaeota archaeon]|nr:MFS transporter [Candidatus Marsarchaeota archaeon]